MDKAFIKQIVIELTDDYTEQQILNAFQNFYYRQNWKINTKCLIFSHSTYTWNKAIIKDIYMDNKEEWLKVKYKNKSKEIQRYNQDIQPIIYAQHPHQIIKYINTKSQLNQLQQIKLHDKIKTIPYQDATIYLIIGYNRLYCRYPVIDIATLCQMYYGYYHHQLITFTTNKIIGTIPTGNCDSIWKLTATQIMPSGSHKIVSMEQWLLLKQYITIDHQSIVYLKAGVDTGVYLIGTDDKLVRVDTNVSGTYSEIFTVFLSSRNGRKLFSRQWKEFEEGLWNLFVCHRLYMPQLMNIKEQQIWDIIRFLYVIRFSNEIKRHLPVMILDENDAKKMIPEGFGVKKHEPYDGEVVQESSLYGKIKRKGDWKATVLKYDKGKCLECGCYVFLPLGAGMGRLDCVLFEIGKKADKVMINFKVTCLNQDLDFPTHIDHDFT